ncbi:MAG: class I SAM-dependent methyltransferase [Chloroflexi bacterium]|nr:class I SAM-dependent methyltransferase [Chloroflexota bacterium]
MKPIEKLPSLYRELAEWWPILSIPKDYTEEAKFYQNVILSASLTIPKTLLELGSGGGNNASHLKQKFEMTLVDLSPEMLKVSKGLNPYCEHIQGDMRTVRLGHEFDAVFIHDAIMYMRSEADLFQAIETAYIHCKAGGVALFAPDHTRETFKASTGHGGHDIEKRGLRYLNWTWDTDETDTTYQSYMVYLLRDETDEVRCVVDRHVCGLFGQDEWLRLIAKAGFQSRSLPFDHSEYEPGSAHIFLGIKPK